MDISYDKSYLQDQVDNCTTFDELTPNAFFERVVLDLTNQAAQERFATSQLFMSFKEEIEDPGARVWFDLLEDEGYAGLRIRAIQTSNRDVTERLIKFSQELSDERQNNNSIGIYNGALAANNPFYADLFTPSMQLEIHQGTKVQDIPLSQLLDEGTTYMEQKEENAAIIKSFEMNINFGQSNGEYFPPSASEGSEHLSYFVFVYIDLQSAAEVYGIDIDFRNRLNLFPYGQISFVNVLGEYNFGLNMAEVGSGPGKQLLCDLRQLRRFRQQANLSSFILPESFSSIRNAIDDLTEREINRLTGDQGHYTEFWHSKDQKDDIRFIFGFDFSAFANQNCSYPILLRNNRLKELSGLEDLPVLDHKDLKVRKIRLRNNSKGVTALAGNPDLEIFDEFTDYTYVGGVRDFANPIYRDGRAKFIENQLEQESDSQDIRFFTGKDNLKKNPTAPGTYRYRVESTFIDNSPEIIKGLVRRLDRQAHILRRAHNQLAGRHVFNQDFVSEMAVDQPGAIATRTRGGFFLSEEGTDLVIQERTFRDIRGIISPAANVVADIADEIGAMSGFFGDNRFFSLKRVIQIMVNIIRPDSTGLNLLILEEITDFAEYLANHFRRSINQSLVNYTSDEYKGTLSSGTGSDVVGGKRILKDVHEFTEIVKNLRTKNTGIDLISWWEQVDQGYGIKGYSHNLYIKRVEGEISKFYKPAFAPTLDNTWTYMTPALIKVAGRKPISPYVLGDRTRSSMYSYEQFADLHADLYDYKFNSKHRQPYRLNEATYSEHDKTKDRMSPDTYQNRTIKQILNQHCEIKIGAIDEKYRDKSGKPEIKESTTSNTAPPAGLYQIFGSANGTADETTADGVEAGFGDSSNQKKKIIDDYYVSVTSKQPKTFAPTVTRIFYTLMGEMVLTPNAAEYADARFNSFAGIEDRIAIDTREARIAQPEFFERQELVRSQLQQAEEQLEVVQTEANNLARDLHQRDIDQQRRYAEDPMGNDGIYPRPTLQQRIDPRYIYAAKKRNDEYWHPTYRALASGRYWDQQYINIVRTFRDQVDRIDELCRFVRRTRVPRPQPNSPLGNLGYYSYYKQLKDICDILERIKLQQAAVDRLREELVQANAPPEDSPLGFRRRELPIQLQALTDIANYRIDPGMGAGAVLSYNQPILTAEPYTQIPTDKSMLAISDIIGNSVRLSNVYDIMKDHSKFAPFWFNFKHIYEIQYLVGFDTIEGLANIRRPNWQPLTERTYVQDEDTGEVKPILCRVVSYDNLDYGVEGLNTTSLPIYNKYFFLEGNEKKASLPPDEKDYGNTFVIDPSFTPSDLDPSGFTPALPPGISSTPLAGLDFGNETGFFGVTPGFDFSGMTNIADVVEPTGSGIINPRTNINTMTSGIMASNNMALSNMASGNVTMTSVTTSVSSNIGTGVGMSGGGSGY